jgi:limonene-1,2-epoxide hydrolase
VSTPVEVVTKYFDLMDAAISTRDPAILAERAALVSPDIFYQNVPLTPIRGVAEHNEWKSGFAGTEFMRGRIVHIAQDGDWVLMERDEEWRLNGITVGGRIMGIMKVVDGKITEWTDYQAHYPAWRASGQMPESFWKRWEEAGTDRDTH